VNCWVSCGDKLYILRMWDIVLCRYVFETVDELTANFLQNNFGLFCDYKDTLNVCF